MACPDIDKNMCVYCICVDKAFSLCLFDRARAEIVI